MYFWQHPRLSAPASTASRSEQSTRCSFPKNGHQCIGRLRNHEFGGPVRKRKFARGAAMSYAQTVLLGHVPDRMICASIFWLPSSTSRFVKQVSSFFELPQNGDANSSHQRNRRVRVAEYSGVPGTEQLGMCRCQLHNRCNHGATEFRQEYIAEHRGAKYQAACQADCYRLRCYSAVIS